MRATLGATRTRLFRQLLTEDNFVLAAASGVIGLCLSAAVLNTLVSLLPPGLLLVPAIRVDLRMVGIAGSSPPSRPCCLDSGPPCWPRAPTCRAR